ncbi:DNA methyltransferase [Actinomycetes bacterium KLBMP 9797]
MRAWMPMSAASIAAQRPAGADEDVHFPEELVAEILAEYTAPGDRVLDPFAGFGTTLVVAERMARRAVGVELLDERVRLIRARLTGDAQVVNGDTRHLAAVVTGPFDLCLTSPPYMASADPENPLTAYETLDAHYGKYLAEIGDVFRQVVDLLRPGGHLVINVANIKVGDAFTPLAWDMARVVAAHIPLSHEVFLCWDEQPEELTGDYCLIFTKP